MPAPYFAVLPERVELETLALPLFLMPPPLAAVLPERVELVTLMVASFQIAPPLLVAVLLEMV